MSDKRGDVHPTPPWLARSGGLVGRPSGTAATRTLRAHTPKPCVHGGPRPVETRHGPAGPQKHHGIWQVRGGMGWRFPMPNYHQEAPARAAAAPAQALSAHDGSARNGPGGFPDIQERRDRQASDPPQRRQGPGTEPGPPVEPANLSPRDRTLRIQERKGHEILVSPCPCRYAPIHRRHGREPAPVCDAGRSISARGSANASVHGARPVLVCAPSLPANKGHDAASARASQVGIRARHCPLSRSATPRTYPLPRPRSIPRTATPDCCAPR